MEYIVKITNAIFSAMFFPFERMRPDYAILIISLVAGVVMFYLYKWTSCQGRLAKVQQRIKAHILEIQLYKTDLYVMFRALYRVLVKNFTYLGLLLPSATLLIFLVVLIVVQCYPRFEYRPVKPGEGFVLKATMKDWDSVAAGSLRLTVPDGMAVEAGPLPIPSMKEVDWRLRASKPGEYKISLGPGAGDVEKTAVVGEGVRGLSRKSGALSLKGYICDALGSPLPAGSAFSEVEVLYPERGMHGALLLGMSWVVYFFVVSFVVALIMKFITKAH